MRSIRSIAALLLGIIFLAPSVPAYAATTSLETTIAELREYVARMVDARSGTPLTDDELRALIASGSSWIVRSQESSGHFRYEYHPFDDTYSEDDNIVRQTGALYALGEVLKHDADDPFDVGSTAVRAIRYFDRISKETTIDGTAARCVTAHGASTRCELGATALALTGILAYIDHAPEEASQYKLQVEDYLAFILAQQKENGGFRNLHLIGRKNQPETESPFSNGEALLALTRAYNYKADPEVKEAIKAALAYLTKEPFDTALYLWIMAAMKEIDAIDVRLQHTEFVRDFTLWRIERARDTRGTNRNFCAYTEGLVSALTVLKDRIPETTYESVRGEAEYGLRKNRSLQLRSTDATRAFVDNGALTILTQKKPSRGEGGFLTSETEQTQRIDFTQHCVNAYLQMLADVRDKKIDQ